MAFVFDKKIPAIDLLKEPVPCPGVVKSKFLKHELVKMSNLIGINKFCASHMLLTK